MAGSRHDNRPRYVLVVLILAAITLVTLDARGRGTSPLRSFRNSARSALSSLQSGIHETLRPVGNFFAGAVDYGSVTAENTRLRQEIAAGRAAQYEAAYDQAQADQVLRSGHIPFAAQYRTVVANVTDQPSSNFEQTITIGKGASSGIAVGQPVVTPSGLAGQVSAVTRGSATVMLITDPQLVVGVGLPGANVGSARSLGPGRGLEVTVIATSIAPPQLRRGAVLYTSEVGHAFPQGIPVGRVTSAGRTAGEAEPSIAATPFVDTSDMGYATVVLWLPH